MIKLGDCSKEIQTAKKLNKFSVVDRFIPARESDNDNFNEMLLGETENSISCASAESKTESVCKHER